ncbi:MAG: prepilin-type N-terminal cleavage/methylation domain-containing protein [Verrucomicrobia bacterium]|nr:prepilin-type N-terminal cleavage/methylation domain-containing protein [Verrucomicrobiota bacterium]
MNAAFPDKGYGSAMAPSRPHRHRTTRRRAGFTLVEMIAVMTIIAILAAAVIGGLVYANRKATVTATKALFLKLQTGIDAFHTDYGKYPPHRIPTAGWDSIDSGTGDPPDHWFPMPDSSSYGSFANLNTGAEILWYFLAGVYEDAENTDLADMEQKSAYVNFSQKELRRTGVVFLNTNDLKENNDPATRDDMFPEIVDPWGVPIQYNASGHDGAQPLVNTETYDLISRGPDRFVVNPYNDRDATSSGGKYVNRDNIGNFTIQ